MSCQSSATAAFGYHSFTLVFFAQKIPANRGEHDRTAFAGGVA